MNYLGGDYMPRKDGTGPSGNGPKKIKQGTPTPRRDGSGPRNVRNNKRGVGRGRSTSK